MPVVALESTLVTHGLPRPLNLDVARRAEATVRAHGATPATIAISEGAVRIGLDEASLAELAEAIDVPKASRQNLAAVLGQGGWAGTTVSATMIAAARAGIGVFATGGIGGVHRGALGQGRGAASFDISADLEELPRTPVVVVCAGPKSILDAGLTLEYLETRGVPVVGYGTDDLAGFWSRSAGVPVPIRCDRASEVAALARRHWDLGLASGVVVAVPVPDDEALARAEADRAIDRALDEAERAGIHGPATTPFLLARVAELTGGRSIRANVALIEHNAAVAAEIALAFALRE